MKRVLVAFMIMLSVLFFSCEEEKAEKSTEDQLDEMVDPEVQDALEEQGMPIHTGDDPPDLTQAFSGGSRAAADGRVYVTDDLDNIYDSQTGEANSLQNLQYYYNLYDQDDTEITMDYTNIYSDEGTGIESLIMGEGNDFTIAGTQTGTSSGIDYEISGVYTGTIGANGIEDFYFAFVMNEKDGDDDNYVLMPEDSFRIYVESDQLVEVYDGAYPSGASRQLLDNLISSASAVSK